MSNEIEKSAAELPPEVSKEIKALERLIGGGLDRIVVINGTEHTVNIRQIKTGKIPKLLAASGSLLPTLTDKRVELDFMTLILFHTDSCLNMLSVLLNMDRALLDEMEIDDAASLLSDCLEVNIDFFVQKVLPLLSGGLVRLEQGIKDQKARLKSLGQTQPTS